MSQHSDEHNERFGNYPGEAQTGRTDIPSPYASQQQQVGYSMGGASGAEQRKPRRWRWVVGGLVTALVLFVIVGVALAPAPATAPSGGGGAVSSSAAADSAPAMTKAQQQAVGAAQDYLSSTGFSKAGLVDQLTSQYGSQFSKADATFAVNHIAVDWNQQAVRVAKEYLAAMHFSRSGLIEQLTATYGGRFTKAQAVYAAGRVGL
jgi:Host cell surface-exposed lipoprotein